MKKLLLILLLSTKAFGFDVVSLDKVVIDYKTYLPGSRDPLINSNGLLNKAPGQSLNLSLNTTLLKYAYFNGTVHSTTDIDLSTNSGQFRVVGLEAELGIRLTPFLNLYYYHYSQHLLDTTYQFGGSPVLDGVGVSIILFSKEKHDSIFNLR